MPAYSDVFPWPNSYGHFNFFDDRMRDHSKVSNLDFHGNGHYTLSLIDGRELSVFVCECYFYCMAEYYETVEKVGPVDAVVISSLWCGYSHEVKLFGRENKVGIFNIKNFMSALNKRQIWLHLDEYEEKLYKERGLI